MIFIVAEEFFNKTLYIPFLEIREKSIVIKSYHLSEESTGDAGNAVQIVAPPDRAGAPIAPPRRAVVAAPRHLVVPARPVAQPIPLVESASTPAPPGCFLPSKSNYKAVSSTVDACQSFVEHLLLTTLQDFICMLIISV